MHHIQKKLLELAKTNNLAECTLRRTAELIGVDVTQNYAEDGDYVLSIIGGMANIKCLKKHEEYISLESESLTPERFPPIIVDQSENCMINGKVIAVYKNTSS